VSALFLAIIDRISAKKGGKEKAPSL